MTHVELGEQSNGVRVVTNNIKDVVKFVGWFMLWRTLLFGKQVVTQFVATLEF